MGKYALPKLLGKYHPFEDRICLITSQTAAHSGLASQYSPLDDLNLYEQAVLNHLSNPNLDRI